MRFLGCTQKSQKNLEKNFTFAHFMGIISTFWKNILGQVKNEKVLTKSYS